jgi:hypothetical protein
MGETRTLITDTLSNRCSGGPCEPKDLRNISINYTSRRHDDPPCQFLDSRSNKTRSRNPTGLAHDGGGDLQFEIFA